MAERPKPQPVTKADYVCQFLIVPRTDPLGWRRIQVPEGYSFWDLHVAIQDATGWNDHHLHEFIVVDSKTSPIAFGSHVAVVPTLRVHAFVLQTDDTSEFAIRPGVAIRWTR